MDFGFEVNGFIILAIIGVLGAAGIAGGIALYRWGDRPSVRAFGAASVAAGTVMWALVLVGAPTSSSTSGVGTPEGAPASSAVCAPDSPNCDDTIVVPNDGGATGDELDTEVLSPDVRFDDEALDDSPSVGPQLEPEPGIAVGEPHPLPYASDPKGPAQCDPDGSVSINSDGKIDCLAPIEVDPLPPVETPSDEDLVRPVAAPTLEPGDADAYGREVPIGTFDQDGESEPSLESETLEGAPVADGVMASSNNSQ